MEKERSGCGSSSTRYTSASERSDIVGENSHTLMASEYDGLLKKHKKSKRKSSKRSRSREHTPTRELRHSRSSSNQSLRSPSSPDGDGALTMTQASTKTNALNAIVEYSDVSSEDFSDPEAGEINSEPNETTKQQSVDAAVSNVSKDRRPSTQLPPPNAPKVEQQLQNMSSDDDTFRRKRKESLDNLSNLSPNRVRRIILGSPVRGTKSNSGAVTTTGLLKSKGDKMSGSVTSPNDSNSGMLSHHRSHNDPATKKQKKNSLNSSSSKLLEEEVSDWDAALASSDSMDTDEFEAELKRQKRKKAKKDKKTQAK